MLSCLNLCECMYERYSLNKEFSSKRGLALCINPIYVTSMEDFYPNEVIYFAGFMK